MLSPFYIREMKPGEGGGKMGKEKGRASRGGGGRARKRKGREARKCKCKRGGKEIRKVWICGVYGGKLGIRYIRDLREVRRRAGETRRVQIQRERERGKITKIEERERIYTRPLQRMGGMDEDGQGSRSRLFNFFMEVKPPLCAVLVKRNTFWHKEHFEKELEILFACCESTVLS